MVVVAELREVLNYDGTEMQLFTCDKVELLLKPVAKQHKERSEQMRSKEAKLSCWLCGVCGLTLSLGAGGMRDLRMRVWLSCSP